MKPKPKWRKYVAITMAVLFWLGLALVVVEVFSTISKRDDSDDPKTGERSGLKVYTDNLTGCQYLKGGIFGGTTPRLDGKGNHVGCWED